MPNAKTYSAFLLILAITGCAQPPAKIYFWHPGATNEELHRDMADCRMRMAMMPVQPEPYRDNPNDPGNAGHAMADLGAALQDREGKNAFFQDCMTSKGWQMVTEPR